MPETADRPPSQSDTLCQFLGHITKANPVIRVDVRAGVARNF